MPNEAQPSFSSQDRIIEAAVALLMKDGLRATTTRGVTELAGVSTGLLNHYFRWPELRALAWARIFEAVALDQFPSHLHPKMALEHYFSTAFSGDAETFWRLWKEAADLAATDELMRQAFGLAQTRLDEGLAGVLTAGCHAACWHLADAKATAVRLGALYDGLAGLLLSPHPPIDAAGAAAHLRKAFDLETRATTIET